MTAEVEKHLNTKVTIPMGDIRYLWCDASDRVRLEMIKSIIWTHANPALFLGKIKKTINSESFEATLD